jgi:hypothetical protein
MKSTLYHVVSIEERIVNANNLDLGMGRSNASNKATNSTKAVDPNLHNTMRHCDNSTLVWYREQSEQQPRVDSKPQQTPISAHFLNSRNKRTTSENIKQQKLTNFVSSVQIHINNVRKCEHKRQAQRLMAFRSVRGRRGLFLVLLIAFIKDELHTTRRRS